MFYDIDAEKKELKVNPVATKLSGGKEIRGEVVIALEGKFQPMDCNDSGYRPYYSFTFYDDIEAVFDEIYDLMDGQLYSDDDYEDDDEFEDDYEDDDEFEDDNEFEDDGDDEFEDDYEDDLEIIDVDDEDEEEKEKPKKDEDEKGRLTLKDLFKDDDE